MVMEKFEAYVLLNITTTKRWGNLSETLWREEGVKVYEIEGPWDAFTYFTGSFDDIKKFGARIRRTKNVRTGEIYIVTNSIPVNHNYHEPLALITGYAQPRYGSNEPPINIQNLLEILSNYPHMNKISAVLGGIDLLGELNGADLTEWHAARREILKRLPPYVTIETHRIIGFDGADPFDVNRLI